MSKPNSPAVDNNPPSAAPVTAAAAKKQRVVGFTSMRQDVDHDFSSGSATAVLPETAVDRLSRSTHTGTALNNSNKKNSERQATTVIGSNGNSSSSGGNALHLSSKKTSNLGPLFTRTSSGRRRRMTEKERAEQEAAAAKKAQEEADREAERLANPDCAMIVALWFRERYRSVRAIWKRFMAIPTAFAILNYILPFALELTILTLHFSELHALPRDLPYLRWDLFPRLRSYVAANAVIGALLAFRFVIGLLQTKNSLLRYFFSAYGVVSVLTLPMMMYPGFTDAAAAFQTSAPTSGDHFDALHEVLEEPGIQNRLTPDTTARINSGHILFSIPSVAAWRIWIVYDIIQTIIFASSNVSKSFRAIVFQLSFILTLFFTCMATMQLIFCVERNAFLNTGTSFYFTAATLTTVGYGDYAPTSVLGRAFIITQIFAAMLAVPLLLAETERLLKFLMSLTGYAGSDRHVLIFGELTETEFDMLVTERNNGDGADDPLHLVFVSTKFSQELIDRVSEGTSASQITLCIANQLSSAELQRFSPQRADAALFYSSSMASALRGDYRTIAAAASLKLHHPSLPQYLMMRRTDTAHLVEGAFVVFDRDFLRAALLGTSLQVPGFLPMFLNLIRRVPDKEIWHDEFESSSEEDIDDEDFTHNNNNNSGATATASAKSNGDGGGGGAERNSSTKNSPERAKEGEDNNNNSNYKENHRHNNNKSNSTHNAKIRGDLLKRIQKQERERERAERKKEKPLPWYDMYLQGAKNNIYTIAVPDALVGRTFVVASFIVQLRVGAIPIGLVRDSRVCLNAGATPISSSDSLVVIARSWEELNSKFTKFPLTHTSSSDTAVTKIALRSKEVHFETEQHAAATALWLSAHHNYFPFHNHVILVDLASFVSEPELCAEETFQREQFQVQDMISLASRFPKYQSFVLLSLRPCGDLVQQEWAATNVPRAKISS